MVTFLLCQLSSNYVSKMGGFYFKYTNDKPYLNHNQKKKKRHTQCRNCGNAEIH